MSSNHYVTRFPKAIVEDLLREEIWLWFIWNHSITALRTYAKMQKRARENERLLF